MSPPDPSSSQAGHSGTDWSMILDAGDSSSPTQATSINADAAVLKPLDDSDDDLHRLRLFKSAFKTLRLDEAIIPEDA